MIATILLSTLLFPAAAEPPKAIAWEMFYESIRASGLQFTDRMMALHGRRVRLRGHAVSHPRIAGGVVLTRFEHADPHGVAEHDLPFDAVAVLWRAGIELPPVPRRPTIEGILRLGNRRFGETVVVTVTIEDAIPIVPG